MVKRKAVLLTSVQNMVKDIDARSHPGTGRCVVLDGGLALQHCGSWLSRALPISVPCCRDTHSILDH